jgi:hypothetical protein
VPTGLISSGGTIGTLGLTGTLVGLGNLKLHLLSASAAHHRRARVSYTLTAAGRVQLVLYRRVISHRCPAPAHACARYARTKLNLSVSGHAGANALRLDLGVLPPGDYRLAAAPVEASGAAATTHYVFFTLR